MPLHHYHPSNLYIHNETNFHIDHMLFNLYINIKYILICINMCINMYKICIKICINMYKICIKYV